MLGTVNPLGERTRNSRWGITIAVFVVSTAGGAVVGAVAGLLGVLVLQTLPMSGQISSSALALILAVGLAFDLHIGGLALPTVKRQVDDRWLYEFRPWVYALGFGFQLGGGAFTIVTTSLVYASIAASLVTGSAAAGAVVSGTFGAVRGMTALLGYWVKTPNDLATLDRRLIRLEQPARVAARLIHAVLLLIVLSSAVT